MTSFGLEQCLSLHRYISVLKNKNQIKDRIGTCCESDV